LYKNFITNTNHQNPEKDLLDFEVLMQTVRLVGIDAFKHDDPEITDMIQRLIASAPTLFSSLVPHEAAVVDASNKDLDDPSVSLKIVDDNSHHRTRATIRLKAMHCKSVLGLPIIDKDISAMQDFHTKLTTAYKAEYDMNIVVLPSNNPVRWWKRYVEGGWVSPKRQPPCSFRLPQCYCDNITGAKRLVFTRGDYVAYIRDGVAVQARLELLFISFLHSPALSPSVAGSPCCGSWLQPRTFF
jgi:hypothetical protein